METESSYDFDVDHHSHQWDPLSSILWNGIVDIT
jgi:hypothetical protein